MCYFRGVNVTPPPHQKTHELPQDLSLNYLENSSEDLGGWFPTQETASQYHSAMSPAYHEDRLRAIKFLVSHMLLSVSPNKSSYDVLDFGIGDGVELTKLGLPLGRVVGIDLSPHMVSLARENLKDFDSELAVGGVSALRDQGEDSVDVVVSTNVLGYLSPQDERDFFLEAARVLRPGGYVMLTLGNELFDLFALNSGTASFFESHFSVIGSARLLTEGDKPRLGNARRHNPLSIEAEVAEFGFTREEYAFSQWHSVPPILEEVAKNKGKNEARLSSRNHDFDANSLSSIERWKAFFQCSIFGLLLRKS